uniref:Dendritic cell-specific transmembrane protein-like domain-containing protein n=1 Tax=Timema poppense TaxID=170557 RepID=A0A7R9CIW5_TIMPO|nr:unnamed protein product [Timema poppensis]
MLTCQRPLNHCWDAPIRASLPHSACHDARPDVTALPHSTFSTLPLTLPLRADQPTVLPELSALYSPPHPLPFIHPKSETETSPPHMPDLSRARTVASFVHAANAGLTTDEAPVKKVFVLSLVKGFYNAVLVDLSFTPLLCLGLGTILCILIGLGNAFSVQAIDPQTAAPPQIRCITLLTIPTMCGRGGRGVLKSLVLALVVAGPIKNLAFNGREIIRVFSCTSGLTFNLTKNRFDMMFRPFQEAILSLKGDTSSVKEAMNTVKDAIVPVAEEIEGEEEMRKIKEDNDYLDELHEDTKRSKELEEKYRAEVGESKESLVEKKYKKKLEEKCGVSDRCTQCQLAVRSVNSVYPVSTRCTQCQLACQIGVPSVNSVYLVSTRCTQCQLGVSSVNSVYLVSDRCTQCQIGVPSVNSVYPVSTLCVLTRGAEKCRTIFASGYDKCYNKVTWLAAWLLCWPMKLTFVCNILQGISKAIFRRDVPVFAWSKRAENYLGKTTLSTPDRDSNLDFPVMGSLAYCESSSLDQDAVKEAIGGSSTCDPTQFLQPGFGEGYQHIKSSRKKISEEMKAAKIQYKVIKLPPVLNIREASDTAQEMMRDFQEKKRLLDTALMFVKRLLAFTFIKILLRLMLGLRTHTHTHTRVLLDLSGLRPLDVIIRGLAVNFFSRAQASPNAIVRGIGDYDPPALIHRRIRDGRLHQDAAPELCETPPGWRSAQLEAQNYHDKFRTKIDFDNVYVTSYFRRIDARRHKQGHHTLLPLKKVERFKFIDPYAVLPNKFERKNLVSQIKVCTMIPIKYELRSLTNVILAHMEELSGCGHQTFMLFMETMSATSFLLMDRLLYEALSLVERHGLIMYQQEGHHDIQLSVIGTGMIATLVRSVLKGFNVKRRIKTVTSNEACLPHPELLDSSYIYKIYGIYMFIWLLMFSEAYSQRLRRAICAYFYPEIRLSITRSSEHSVQNQLPRDVVASPTLERGTALHNYSRR